MSKNAPLVVSYPLLITVKLVRLPKVAISLHPPKDSAPESSSNATIQHLFDAKVSLLLILLQYLGYN